MAGSLALANLVFLGLRPLRFFKNEASAASLPLLPKMGDTEVIAGPPTPAPRVLVLERESLFSSGSNTIMEADEVKPNL